MSDSQSSSPTSGDPNSTPPASELAKQLAATLGSVRSRFNRESARVDKESSSGGIGRWIGDASHHPGSIAFIAVIGLLICLFTCLIIFAFAPTARLAVIIDKIHTTGAALIALLGTILGYIFGKANSR
ncbi:hypothetical protein [Bosea sp. TND4EK4]|uniref:hypothetical protein n=1 Tax=Bosea sp. TND4EK4 TaxID=1907408 RepID=UPI00158CF7EA|nr:hypothetical protein [Bosea sp. TND4EK4]